MSGALFTLSVQIKIFKKNSTANVFEQQSSPTNCGVFSKIEPVLKGHLIWVTKLLPCSSREEAEPNSGPAEGTMLGGDKDMKAVLHSTTMRSI